MKEAYGYAFVVEGDAAETPLLKKYAEPPLLRFPALENQPTLQILLEFN
jgi:hypothetical protein